MTPDLPLIDSPPASAFATRPLQPSLRDPQAHGDGSSPATAAHAALPLVSRRWRRVFCTSAALHGTLNLHLQHLEGQLTGPEDAAALLRALQLRGTAARRLWLHSDGTAAGPVRMAHVLRTVSPRLQSVYLGQDVPANSLSHLSRFASLRSLDLPAIAYGCGSALAAFTQLEELTLREGLSEELLG